LPIIYQVFGQFENLLVSGNLCQHKRELIKGTIKICVKKMVSYKISLLYISSVPNYMTFWSFCTN